LFDEGGGSECCEVDDCLGDGLVGLVEEAGGVLGG